MQPTISVPRFQHIKCSTQCWRLNAMKSHDSSVMGSPWFADHPRPHPGILSKVGFQYHPMSIYQHKQTTLQHLTHHLHFVLKLQRTIWFKHERDPMHWWAPCYDAKDRNRIARGGEGGERQFQEIFGLSIIMHQVFGAQNRILSRWKWQDYFLISQWCQFFQKLQVLKKLAKC